MISDDDRRSVLSAYASGFITRYSAIELLGIGWYGDLLDAMSEAGLVINLPAEQRQSMRKILHDLLGGMAREPVK